jgi:hypothetical protein
MDLMEEALREVGLPARADAALRAFLGEVATFLVNR